MSEEDNKKEETVTTDNTVSIEKDEFVDKDGVEDAIMGSAFSKDVPAVPAKIFIEEDAKVIVEIDILSDKKTGKIVNVFKKDSFPIGDEMKALFGYSVESFEFSIPTFEDITLYRQQSSNNPTRVIDKNILRNYFIVMHLKDWSLKNEKGEKINLDFEINGGLSTKSTRLVNRVPTVIWDVVLTIFERETLIS